MCVRNTLSNTRDEEEERHFRGNATIFVDFKCSLERKRVSPRFLCGENHSNWRHCRDPLFPVRPEISCELPRRTRIMRTLSLSSHTCQTVKMAQKQIDLR